MEDLKPGLYWATFETQTRISPQQYKEIAEVHLVRIRGNAPFLECIDLSEHGWFIKSGPVDGTRFSSFKPVTVPSFEEVAGSQSEHSTCLASS